jgi:hypothetical protein
MKSLPTKVGQRVWVEVSDDQPASGTITSVAEDQEMVTVTLDVEVDNQIELTVPTERVAIFESTERH